MAASWIQLSPHKHAVLHRPEEGHHNISNSCFCYKNIQCTAECKVQIGIHWYARLAGNNTLSEACRFFVVTVSHL